MCGASIGTSPSAAVEVKQFFKKIAAANVDPLCFPSPQSLGQRRRERVYEEEPSQWRLVGTFRNTAATALHHLLSLHDQFHPHISLLSSMVVTRRIPSSKFNPCLERGEGEQSRLIRHSSIQYFQLLRCENLLLFCMIQFLTIQAFLAMECSL